MNGGEGGVDVGGVLDVVEAGDGDVFGDSEAFSGQHVDRADGHFVVAAEEGGEVWVAGERYGASRHENRRLKLRALPEEPLRSASVAALSVAHNMALRDFDEAPLTRGWIRFRAWGERARRWITEYGIKTRGENAPIGSLSGGNVQRAVLARELAGEVKVLIAANPVFGLDFAAVAEIHARLLQVRAKGGAVLLVSEDLDELLMLADRVAVMSEGRIVFEAAADQIDRRTVGEHMGGSHAHEAHVAPATPAEEEAA